MRNVDEMNAVGLGDNWEPTIIQHRQGDGLASGLQLLEGICGACHALGICTAVAAPVPAGSPRLSQTATAMTWPTRLCGATRCHCVMLQNFAVAAVPAATP